MWERLATEVGMFLGSCMMLLLQMLTVRVVVQSTWRQTRLSITGS